MSPPEQPMERYDLLYRLYDEFETGTLRDSQEFVDLFPPVDSRVALNQWQEVNDDLDGQKENIRERFPQDVLDHVTTTDDLTFARGDAAEMLRTAYALNRLAALDG